MLTFQINNDPPVNLGENFDYFPYFAWEVYSCVFLRKYFRMSWNNDLPQGSLKLKNRTKNNLRVTMTSSPGTPVFSPDTDSNASAYPLDEVATETPSYGFCISPRPESVSCTPTQIPINLQFEYTDDGRPVVLFVKSPRFGEATWSRQYVLPAVAGVNSETTFTVPGDVVMLSTTQYGIWVSEGVRTFANNICIPAVLDHLFARYKIPVIVEAQNAGSLIPRSEALHADVGYTTSGLDWMTISELDQVSVTLRGRDNDALPMSDVIEFIPAPSQISEYVQDLYPGIFSSGSPSVAVCGCYPTVAFVTEQVFDMAEEVALSVSLMVNGGEPVVYNLTPYYWGPISGFYQTNVDNILSEMRNNISLFNREPVGSGDVGAFSIATRYVDSWPSGGDGSWADVDQTCIRLDIVPTENCPPDRDIAYMVFGGGARIQSCGYDWIPGE